MRNLILLGTLIAALVCVDVAQARRYRRGGGCPNGQCGVVVSKVPQATQKSAVQAQANQPQQPDAVAARSTGEAAPAVASSRAYQYRPVRYTPRRRLFRWFR